MSSRVINAVKILVFEHRLPITLKYLFDLKNLNNYYMSKVGSNSLGKNKNFKKLIKNQRILILGAGPSANDLKKIPKDVKIFTCNACPRILNEKGIDREIDLYLCSKFAFEFHSKRGSKIEEQIKNNKIKYFMTDEPNFMLKKMKNNTHNFEIIKENAFNNYYIKELIKPIKLNDILKGPGSNNSSGMKLLAYALYFDAKEVYMIGMGGPPGKVWKEKVWDKEKKKKFVHDDEDNAFIGAISNKFNNIFLASKNMSLGPFKYKKM